MVANGSEIVEVPLVVDKALNDVAAKLRFKKPSFTVTSGSGARDGYLSTMYRANIHDADPAGRKDVSVMCKVPLADMDCVMKRVFAVECHIYSAVVPAMEAAAGPGAAPNWPRVLQVAADAPHCVTLEDFRPLGFGPAEGTRGLDADHCRLLAQQLAKFHAAGFILKHLQPDKFAALKAPLGNTFVSDEIRYTFDVVFRDIANLPDLLLERWPEDSKTYKMVRKACEEGAKDISGLVEPRNWENNGEGCCLAHGDCKINNAAFKYDKDTGQVVDCLLYDFQTVHFSSPAVDLTRVLLGCTDKDVRDAHLDDILRGYLRDLHAHMRAGGIQDPNSVYSWDLLQKHCKRTALWATLMQPMLHNLQHADDTVIAQVRAAIAKAGAGGKLEEACSRTRHSPQLRSRFVDTVQDVADRGWLPTEEEIDKWMAGEA